MMVIGIKVDMLFVKKGAAVLLKLWTIVIIQFMLNFCDYDFSVINTNNRISNIFCIHITPCRRNAYVESKNG